MPASHKDPTLPDRLNDFYAQFEAKNNNNKTKVPSPSPSEQVPQVTAAQVKKVFASANPCKVAGPDNIPGRVVRECAEQLKDVFTDVSSQSNIRSNISLTHGAVPTRLKSTTIIPVP